MREHWLNEINRRVIARAQAEYDASGDMALAVREAASVAHHEVQALGREDGDPLFSRDVENIRYCAGRLVEFIPNHGRAA